MNAIEIFFNIPDPLPRLPSSDPWENGLSATERPIIARPARGQTRPAKSAKDDGGGDSWSSTGQINFFLLQLIREVWLAELAGYYFFACDAFTFLPFTVRQPL